MRLPRWRRLCVVVLLHLYISSMVVCYYYCYYCSSCCCCCCCCCSIVVMFPFQYWTAHIIYCKRMWLPLHTKIADVVDDDDENAVMMQHCKLYSNTQTIIIGKQYCCACGCISMVIFCGSQRIANRLLSWCCVWSYKNPTLSSLLTYYINNNEILFRHTVLVYNMHNMTMHWRYLREIPKSLLILRRVVSSNKNEG